MRKIHACFFKPDTTPEVILSYMKKKSPNDGYSVEKIKLAHNHYSSFAITVPSSQFEFFMAAKSWPPSTEVSEWFRRSNGRASGASSGRLRRCGRPDSVVAGTERAAGPGPASSSRQEDSRQ